MNFRLRKAVKDDIPCLRELIEASVRGLQAQDYTPAQIEGAVESPDDGQIIACGGWSKRKTLYGGDQYAAREDSLLDPLRDAAKIRAFFVHPQWARRGLGSVVLEACESAAIAAGFSRLEMGATLSGVPFYRAKGYAEIENQSVPLGNGETLAIVRMSKDVRKS